MCQEKKQELTIALIYQYKNTSNIYKREIITT